MGSWAARRGPRWSCRYGVAAGARRCGASRRSFSSAWDRMPALPAGQGDVVVVGTIFARLNVQAMLPTLCEVIDDWRPNLVVRESAEYASALAAESRGVRHGRVGIGLAVTEEWTLA